MPSVSVRYFVDDVDAAIEFNTERLGFEEVMHSAPAYAMLALGDLRLLLRAPGGGPGGGKGTPDGQLPQNREVGTASRSRSRISRQPWPH